MKLFINQKEINFTFQQEKNLLDVFRSLRDWGQKNDLFLSELNVNGQWIPFEKNLESYVFQTVLDDIHEVRANFLSRYAYAINLLFRLESYLKKSVEMLENKGFDENVLNSLTEDFITIREGIEVVCTTLHLKEEVVRLSGFMKQMEVSFFHQKEALSQSSVKTFSESSRHATINFMKELLGELNLLKFRGNLMILQHNFHSIGDEAKTTSTKETRAEISELVEATRLHLRQMMVIFKEAAICFQSGKDARGMVHVKNIMDTFGMLFVLFDTISRNSIKVLTTYAHRIVEGPSFRTWSQALNKQLLNLEKAMKMNDYVYLSDILEYELTECTQTLLSRFDKVIDVKL